MRRELFVSLLVLGLVATTATNIGDSKKEQRVEQRKEQRPTEQKPTEQKPTIKEQQHNNDVQEDNKGEQQQKKVKKAVEELKKLKQEVLDTEKVHLEKLKSACERKKAAHILKFTKTLNPLNKQRLLGTLLSVECKMQRKSEQVIKSITELSEDPKEFVPQLCKALAKHLKDNKDHYRKMQLVFADLSQARRDTTSELYQAWKAMLQEDNKLYKVSDDQIGTILIGPVQRGPRYQLFVTSIIKAAGEANLDESVIKSAKESLEIIKDVLTKVNAAKFSAIVEPFKKLGQKIKNWKPFDSKPEDDKPEDKDAATADDDSDGDDDTDSDDNDNDADE